MSKGKAVLEVYVNDGMPIPYRSSCSGGKYLYNYRECNHLELQWSCVLKNVAFNDDPTKLKLAKVITAAGNRIVTAGDIYDYIEFFLPDWKFSYDEKAFDKHIRKIGAAELLCKFCYCLATTNSFESSALEELMHQFVESEGIKIGQIIHAVRVAVTGKTVGFGLFETLNILGRQHCIVRVNRALERI